MLREGGLAGLLRLDESYLHRSGLGESRAGAIFAASSSAGGLAEAANALRLNFFDLFVLGSRGRWVSIRERRGYWY